MSTHLPPQPVAAVILCGGYSSRMGRDKALLVGGDNKTQLQRCIELVISADCAKVFVSCRKDQLSALEDNIKGNATEVTFITDENTFEDIGPAAGLLSVLQHVTKPTNPKNTLVGDEVHQPVANAYLVLAVDFPLIQLDGLSHLIDRHHSDSLLTCYVHSIDNMPEPLCSVWTLPALYALHYNCTVHQRTGPCHTIKQLRRQSPGLVQYLQPLDPTTLFNSNTPSEQQQALDIKRNKGRIRQACSM